MGYIFVSFQRYKYGRLDDWLDITCENNTAFEKIDGYFMEYHWDKVCFEIVSIDGKMVEFAIGTTDGTKTEIIERSYMSNLICFSKIYRKGEVQGSIIQLI